MLLTCMAVKMQVGFYQGDVLKLTLDLAVLKPTIMVSVPRLYNRFYDLMQAKIKELTGMKKTFTEWGVAKKLASLESKAQTVDHFYDALVFNKFRDILGGRVRTMITGSAPISKEVLNFLKIAFCCQIKEGYGQTESAAGVTVSWTTDPETGHVGAPFPALDVKLVDVPDMNYTSEDLDHSGHPAPRGEVCYRGHSVFKGYFRQPEMTRDTIDKDGWVHTGDIGMLDVKKGTLRIIDRKKNIFKLSQGEYIVPEKVENKISQSPSIAQVFVYGDSLQYFLVAIVVPDRPALEKWAAENGVAVDGGDYEALLKHARINKHILEEIIAKSREAGFFGFEIPQRVHLTSNAFSPDNDILTPTFKLKRNEAKKAFLIEIKALYDGAKLQGEE
jgi:long-chain acyl-CoA synthetase